MKTRISQHDIEEFVLEASYPDQFDGKEEAVTERTYKTDPILGQGFYKEIFFEGIHIGFGDIALTNSLLIDFETDFETIEMHFSFSPTSVQSDDFAQGIDFCPNQHNLIYVNGFKGIAKWPGETNMKVFEVNLLPSFVEKYLPDHIVFEAFKLELKNKRSNKFSSHNFSITPQMIVVINKIMDCNRQGVFKKMFLEAHVIELLMLQLEQIIEHDCKALCSFKEQDIDKLYQIKEIISTRIDKPCSLIGLAQEVGTNEFTLKKGFKELFGTTVFRYWSELKMERAQIMLAEEGLTVTEVSEKVGYRNPQHFSTAFKRKFGYSPRELKSQ